MGLTSEQVALSHLPIEIMIAGLDLIVKHLLT
mgnify:CR=1 FL=1